MNLKDFASELVAKDHFIKASFGGFAGAGKSRTASEFIIGCYKLLKLEKPLLFIDNEKGGRFLKPIFEKAGVKVLLKETESLADVLDAFEFLNNGDIDFLFIDSLTKIWYRLIKDYKEKNKRIFMAMQDWGKILPDWQEKFSNKFVNVTGSCVFTGRGGSQYAMEENEETHKKEFIKTGVKMKLAGETPFETDLNIWMDLNQEIIDSKPHVWREAQILKDRSGLIDGMTFKNPTFKDFKPVVEFILSVPIGDVKGTSNTSNLASSEDYSYMDKKDNKEIFLDKIKNLFAKHDLDGTAKENQKLRIKINELIFGTASKVEIEKKFTCDQIIEGHNKLIEFFTNYFEKFDAETAIKEYESEINQLKAIQNATGILEMESE